LRLLYPRILAGMLALLPVLTGPAAEPSSAPAPEVLFRDVRVFNGKSGGLSGPTAVLVRGNTIAAVGAGAIPANPAASVIDGSGRTLMPGLIDAHVRMMMADTPLVLQAVREQLMKGASHIKLMAGGGVSSDYDPLDVSQYTEDEMRAAVEAAAAWNTYVTVHAYTPQAIQQAIRAGVRCIDPVLATRQGKQLVKMQRWFTPAQTLRMATHDKAELVALSGPRNPYPGRLGVVEAGALADLLLVDGNPLENLALVATPETSFVVIMKDGRIYKNSLH
jgi:imidazolonepropionase-like amidohydrolase